MSRHKYPAVNYNLTPCEICAQFLSFQELRQAVYWLPDMDRFEYSCACYEGFVFKFAHRTCWNTLREKRRALIRLCSYKNQEPRALGQAV